MDKIQINELLAFIQQTWPRADLDDADLDSWGRVLARVHNPDLARQALIRLKDTTNFNGPNRAAFQELLSQQSSTTRRTLHDGLCGMFIQCAEGPHKGNFKTLYWPTDKEKPPEHVILATMETFRADHERLYGGTWQLIRSMQGPVTEAEMMTRMHQLRGTIPFEDRQAGTQPDVEYRGTPTRENSRAVPVRQSVADFMSGIKPDVLEPLPTDADVPAGSARGLS